MVLSKSPEKARNLGLLILLISFGLNFLHSLYGSLDLLLTLILISLTFAMLLKYIFFEFSSYKSFVDLNSNLLLVFSIFYLFFFNIGPFFHFFGDQFSDLYSRIFFNYSNAEFFNSVFLNSIALGIVFSLYNLNSFYCVHNYLVKFLTKKNCQTEKKQIIFYAPLSFFINFVIIINSYFDYRYMIPGFIHIISLVSLSAFYISIIKYGPKLHYLLMLTFISFGGYLVSNKTFILIPIIIILAAFFVRKPSPKKFILIFYSIFLISSMSHFIVFNKRIDNNTLHISLRDTPSFWVRLDYIAPQIQAINSFDFDSGGDSYKNILWSLVPRFIFSSKPILSTLGNEFNFKYLGFGSTATGIGFFINGYYDFGYAGLFIISSLFAFLIRFYATLMRVALIFSDLLLISISSVGYLICFTITFEYLTNLISFGFFGLVLFIFYISYYRFLRF